MTLKTGLFSVFGVSNLYLALKATDYFADATRLNAFMHTWSLGVEEQFYLFFPILVWWTALHRTHNTRAFVATMIVLCAVSLVLFVYLTNNSPQRSYYLMPPRFWQLGVGALTFALAARSAGQGSHGSAIAFVALNAVLFLPARWHLGSTVAVTFLTAYVIHTARTGTIAHTLLTTRVAVYVGLISYSLYLWHWPVLSISRWTIGVYWWTVAVQLPVMFLLAAWSYKHVETPLRDARWSPSRWGTIAYGATACCATAAAVAVLSGPLNGRLYAGTKPQLIQSGVESLMTPYSIDGASGRWQGSRCILSDNKEVGKVISRDQCTLGDPSTASVRVLVIGNSFSAAFTHDAR